MKQLLNVFIKFERGNGDFRTVLEFCCESVHIIGNGCQLKDSTPRDDLVSLYLFNYIYDVNPFQKDGESLPLSEALKTDNNKDLFNYYPDYSRPGKNCWFADIASIHVTTLKITPVILNPITIDSIEKEN